MLHAEHFQHHLLQKNAVYYLWALALQYLPETK